MFYCFKSNDRKSVLRISISPMISSEKLDALQKSGYTQCEHSEFVNLRKQIQKKGYFVSKVQAGDGTDETSNS